MKTYKLTYRKTINGAIQVNNNKKCKPFTHDIRQDGIVRITKEINKSMIERYKLRYE